MAHPLPAGLMPQETAFLCELESVTIIPRQRLESLQLLGGPTPALRPPQRATLPLWLALLLKRQRRANIAPPPWLHPIALQEILDLETSTSYSERFTPSTPLSSTRGASSNEVPTPTPPFLESSTATMSAETLPYHYLELSTLLLTHCADDIPDVEAVQRLVRDLREVRQSKLRALVNKVDGGAGVNLNGIGALEIGESRAFLGGVVDGLRALGTSREAAEREAAEETEREGLGGGAAFGEEEDEMEL